MKLYRKVKLNLVFRLIILMVFLSSCKKNENKINSSKKNEVSLKSFKDGVQLLDQEVSSIFSVDLKKSLKINYGIFKVYKYIDKQGLNFLVFTENLIQKDDYEIANKIEAISFLYEDNKYYENFRLNYSAKEDEESVWFGTTYNNLKDLNGDGLIDPIIVHGSTSSEEDEGTVEIEIIYLNTQTHIFHRESRFDESRYTKFDESFSELPTTIKEKILKIFKAMEKGRHATFNGETIKRLRESVK